LNIYDFTDVLTKQMYKKIITLDKGNKTIVLSGIFVFILTLALISSNYHINNDFIAFATTLNNTQTQPNINAKSIYDTGAAVLGNNVKNLIILIPDEAHHGNGEAKENRFIEQSFLPQTAVINKGTKVIWFSGDVSHEHQIILNNDKSLFDSGTLPEFTESNPMVFNTVGNFGYISPDIDQEAVQKGFVMKGDIKVVDQPDILNSSTNNTASGSSNSVIPSNNETQTTNTLSPTNTATTSSDNNIETVGVFMVPTKDIDEYRGFLRKYRNQVEPIISSVYNSYLQANDQPEGKRTYNMVIAYLIAYYKKFGKDAL